MDANVARRILVVEDDQAVAATIKQHMSRRGYIVATVGTCDEADAMIADAIPNLIILDLYLPDRHGRHLLKKLSESDIPVIVMSGTADEDELIQAMCDYGAADCIRKPFSLEMLTAKAEIRLRYMEHSADHHRRDSPAPSRPSIVIENHPHRQGSASRTAEYRPRFTAARMLMDQRQLGVISRFTVTEVLLADRAVSKEADLAIRACRPVHVIRYHWKRDVMKLASVRLQQFLQWGRRFREVELSMNGKKPMTIAVELGVDECTIYRDLRAFDLPLRREDGDKILMDFVTDFHLRKDCDYAT